jgi:hypothetical protein
MRLPNNIKTLFELSRWVELKNPKTIEIYPEGNILEIREFAIKNWQTYRGIPITYRPIKMKLV